MHSDGALETHKLACIPHVCVVLLFVTEDFLEGLIHDSGEPGWWFGANDKDTEDVWVFDNGAAVPYTDWFPGMFGFISWATHLSHSFVNT